ncbi:MAG: GNAT family N-acetyltransferase [Hyphomicrobiales bacterium]
MRLSPPEPLGEQHDVVDFESGVRSLDEWLRRRARANQVSGASRTFVACEGRRVAGYYAVASGAVAISSTTARLRRNMPDPVPVVLLGRLAVDRRYQGAGIGRALFRDAAQRISEAADMIGIRGILVHAISQDAKRFYEALGFEPSPLDEMTLMVTLKDVRAVLGEAD